LPLSSYLDGITPVLYLIFGWKNTIVSAFHLFRYPDLLDESYSNLAVIQVFHGNTDKFIVN